MKQGVVVMVEVVVGGGERTSQGLDSIWSCSDLLWGGTGQPGQKQHVKTESAEDDVD